MKRTTLPVTTPLRYLDNTPLIIVSLLIFDSLHFIFARLLLPYFPPTTSSLYVMALATVEVGLFVKLGGVIHFDILRRHLLFFLSVGFLVAASTILTFMSVAFIDPGTASLLGKSSIVFGLVLGILWLKDRFVPVQIAGAIVAILGVVIISFQPGDYWRFGSFIVVVSSLMYALHNALFKRFGGGIPLADFFLFRLAATTFFLLLIALARHEMVMPSGWSAWVVLILTGTVNIVLSRALYYLALQRLNLSLHSIILTLSPVAAIGWTLLLFGIWPTSQQLIGGLAVILGVMLAVGAVRVASIKGVR
ncbi:MAG: DMT family transporter [Anaerolineaceae bacterium]|nr:DMT family transporter [Anaerolineaceae bacterium]MCB9100852.1 DMT family transporter [Anaerolineales bacterium]